jgi:hypothetical protein
MQLSRREPDGGPRKKMEEHLMQHARRAVPKEERSERIKVRIEGLIDELREKGFGDCLTVDGPPILKEEPDLDPKTGGLIGKVKEPVAAYLQRVSVVENYAQRPPFDHANDLIYRRLIRDFIQGAIMPESKIAALNPTQEGQRATELHEPEIKYSIVDGLQRSYCYALAVLLVLYGEKLIADGIITNEAWGYFKQPIAEADVSGNPEEFARRVLLRQMRYEIFWNINLAGLLHYMVTFNTGQRKMALRVQLEIMSRPLLEELEKAANVPVWKENEKLPGKAKPKNAFPASNLVLGTQAFLTCNAQITGGSQAESLLEKEDYLDSFGEIEDVVTTLKRIAGLHKQIMEVYDYDLSGNSRYILSSSDTFFLGLMASCGYSRKNINMKALDAALDKLETELSRTDDDDPLKLEEYRDALQTITASRGKSMRRLVYDTFNRFFNGSTMRLDWADTAQSITGDRPVRGASGSALTLVSRGGLSR